MFRSNHLQHTFPMLQTAACALATAAALSLLLSLSAKGLFRDDGEYEEWCSELHPCWRGVATGVFRCVRFNRRVGDNSDYEDSDEEEEYDNACYYNVDDVPRFKNDDGSVNVDWLWGYITRKETSDRQKDDLIAQQSEYIQRLLHRESARMHAQAY